MDLRNIRIGMVMTMVAALTGIGAGVASATAFDDSGADQGQSGGSGNPSYQVPSGDPAFAADPQRNGGYHAYNSGGNSAGGGSLNSPTNSTDGVVGGLASPENAGSNVTPNGFSPGQTLPGGSLGGL